MAEFWTFSEDMTAYLHTQKGRSLTTAFVTAFAALLAFFFFQTGDPVFTVGSVVLGLLAISGAYAFLPLSEMWILGILL